MKLKKRIQAKQSQIENDINRAQNNFHNLHKLKAKKSQMPALHKVLHK